MTKFLCHGSFLVLPFINFFLSKKLKSGWDCEVIVSLSRFERSQAGTMKSSTLDHFFQDGSICEVRHDAWMKHEIKCPTRFCTKTLQTSEMVGVVFTVFAAVVDAVWGCSGCCGAFVVTVLVAVVAAVWGCSRCSCCSRCYVRLKLL